MMVTPEDRDDEVIRAFGKGLLVGLVSLATLFVVAGAVIATLAH
jgi:hypothetical protein